MARTLAERLFVQIPLDVLQTTPALGRVVIGAMLKAVREADGHLG
jgi:type IV secretion system protein VirD4